MTADEVLIKFKAISPYTAEQIKAQLTTNTAEEVLELIEKVSPYTAYQLRQQKEDTHVIQ